MHHTQEEKQFARLFRQEGMDRVDDRLNVLRVFLSTEEHITQEDLSRLLADAGYDYDSGFVRDTLRLLVRYGFAQKREFDGRLTRYEHRHLGQHHDHLICIKCGKITEFMDADLERRQVQVAAANGFHMLQHRMEIYGLCGDCLADRVQLLPLTQARPGERMVIRDHAGGAGVRHRLLTMGLRTGDRLEVITNDGQGQVVVAVDCSRYALGRGLAEKILVEPDKVQGVAAQCD